MAGKNRRHGVSRREFINAGLTGTTALLGSSWMPIHGSSRQSVHGACMHDCPDSCAWIVKTDNGRAVALEADDGQPMTGGALCEKMDGFLTDVVYNPDRVLHPLRRVGKKGEGKFERVSWDEALADVSSRLKTIIAEHGPTAILPYSFAGTMGMVQSYTLDRRFFARLGATRLDRNVCGSAGDAGLAATMGTEVGMLPEDIEHSRFILIWGANPILTNPHGWPFIERAKSRGARVVVIDPLRSATAERADWHLQPIPGTDTALALGMMHVIVQENLHDSEYVESYTLGFDRLRERLADYPPERVAQITGLKPKEIVELAKAYAGTRPAAIRVFVGMEKHSNGAMMYRTVACLPALVGAWRELGGGLQYFTSGLFEESLNFEAAVKPSLEDYTIRSVNMVQLGQALTDGKLDPPIRAMIVYNSNPATIAPNQNLVFEGLKRTDLLTVVLDHFVTDTALYADYVFPATTEVEHLDLIVPWGSRYLSLNLPAIDPVGEALPNTEFFRRLARRLGFEESYLYDSDEEIIKAALASDHPYLKNITYERLEREGWAPLDLPSPWLPFAKGGFPTSSGKCEFYAKGLIDQGLDPLPHYEPASKTDSRYPLMFLSTKSRRHFLNSSHANQPRHLRAEGQPRLRIHPEDAAKRGIESGAKVRVYNARGSVEVRAEVIDAMRPNVVTMAHGWWASRIGGSSANALTSDGLSDLGGGGDLHDTRVEVEKLG